MTTKQELLVEVWQQPYGGADMHLSWLRRKLGETAQEARYPHTVRRVGVRLAAPPEPGSADAPAAGRPGIRLMRQRLALLVSATMALVLVTFIVPLAIGVRVIVAGRAVSEATDDVQTLSALIAADPSPADVRGLAAATGRPVTVFLPGQQPIGVPAGQTPAVRLAARRAAGRTAEHWPHGRTGASRSPTAAAGRSWSRCRVRATAPRWSGPSSAGPS